MIQHIVFWGLCAVILFVPLPFGSVEPWAYFVFEAATLVLFLLYVAGGLGRRDGTGETYGRDMFPTGPGVRGAFLPLLVRVLLGVFVAFSVVQVMPLPPAVVKVLSPRAFAIYDGLARDRLGGWQAQGWHTLSLGPHATMEKLVLVLCIGLFGYLVLRTVRTRAKMEIFVLVMIASGLFQAFYGLAEHFSGTERILGFKKRWGVGSATGTYVNRNHFAGFLEMIFPLSLGYLLAKARYFMMEKGLSLRRKIVWFGQERLQWTLLLGLASVFLGMGLVFSRSRSGVLIFLVTVVFAAVAVSGWRTFSEGDEGGGGGGGERKRFGRIVRIVFAVVLAAALWLGVDPVIKRFMDLDITKEERRTFMRNTLEIAADYPLAGVGKGTYVYSYAMYEKVDDWKKLSYAHNDYLQAAAENGFVGGGALVLAGLALFITLVGRWRRREDSFAKGVGLGAILGVAAILLHGLTDFNLQIPANAVYFVALLALAQLGGHYTRPTRFSDLGEEWERRQNGGGAAGADGHASGVTGRRASLFPGMVKAAAGIVVGAVLLLVTVKDFLGDRYYREYQKSRTEVRSIESGFPGLELMLKNAWRFSKNPEYAKELGRLYSDMARVENQAGRDEGREKFCDAAVEAYGRALRGNPIDAFGYFETGMIYLLSNTPLMTYADRAKEYFRKALELKPADEFLHLHILIVYMSLWDVLEEGEKDFVRDGYGKMVGVDPKFPAKLAEEWKKSFGDVERLEELLPLIRQRP